MVVVGSGLGRGFVFVLDGVYLEVFRNGWLWCEVGVGG